MYRYYILFFIFLAFITACKEEKLEPLTKGGKAPAQVTDVKVINRSGKAVLSYTLPKDPELLYVKAEYEIRPGVKMDAISTFYNDSVVLEGFGDTTEREVKLYSINRSEVRSEPLTVKVNPLTPPVRLTFASLSFVADFGGITAVFKNEDSANLAIGVLTKDANGDIIPADMYYTSQKEGSFSVRGFDAQPRWFGLYVRDRWSNYSDTVGQTVTPLYEQKLDKKLFKPLRLPSDATDRTGISMYNLWNDVLVGGSNSTNSWYRTANGSGIPHWFTFDLGVTAKLSRFVMIPRGATDELTLLYSAGDPRLFEIWGSTSPAPDGSFNGWQKLVDCEVIKPSGLPLGKTSNDDILAAQAGHEYKFPFDAPPVRYIRVKMLQTWGNADYMWMAEMTMFGQVQ